MPLMHGQRVRLANPRLQLLQVQRRRDYLMAAFLFEEQWQHQRQRRRTMWVKPWLLRRVTLGHYDTLMQELMRESRGDFKSYLRKMQQFFSSIAFFVRPSVLQLSWRSRSLSSESICCSFTPGPCRILFFL